MHKHTHNKIRLEHITSFGDAVFAFAITFMALSIEIPNLPNNLTEPEVADKLVQLLPQFEIYLISFIIVGIFWIKYHQVFNQIEDSHSIMVWLNLIFLFFITLVSFGTALELNYGPYHSVFIVYAIILTATGALLALIWLYASKNKMLIDKNMSERQIKSFSVQSIIPSLVFISSIGISFIDIQVAQYFWLVIFPAQLFVRRKFAPTDD